MKLSIGDYVTIVKDETVVQGEVTGWNVVEGELYSLRIQHIHEPFVLGIWLLVEEEGTQEND